MPLANHMFYFLNDVSTSQLLCFVFSVLFFLFFVIRIFQTNFCNLGFPQDLASASSFPDEQTCGGWEWLLKSEGRVWAFWAKKHIRIYIYICVWINVDSQAPWTIPWARFYSLLRFLSLQGLKHKQHKHACIPSCHGHHPCPRSRMWKNLQTSGRPEKKKWW